MFNPIKRIITYIQKNASSGTMFGISNSSTADDEGVGSSTGQQENEQQASQSDGDLEPKANDIIEVETEVEDDAYYEDDIERQIKTSIIDATKVQVELKIKEASSCTSTTLLLSPALQLDDELADFEHEPIVLTENDELDEQLLELDHFSNNEIIVLSDVELNSSLTSDNVSEDPLAIDDFTQPPARDSDHVLDSSSVTTNEEVDTSGDLLWLTATTHAVDAPHARPKPGSCTAKLPKSKEEELRSDGGSDSGLGSETSTLQITLNNLSNTSQTTSDGTSCQPPTLNQTPTGDQAISKLVPCEYASTSSASKPLRSNLKRRLEDADSMDLALVSSLVGTELSSTQSVQSKRQKRSINFDNVQVYYFPRQQGFGCVPTVGGCTLGMGAQHIGFKTMSLAEHAAELRRAHRSQNQDMQARGSSSEDTEESEEDYLSEGSGSDADGDSNGFLQPVSPKQRRALLKAAGVRKIDANEKIECRDIRKSREVCGCSCREFCDPETCACSQAGIKCQVDRAMFPCGCSREACGNTVGRVEFNPTRVRTHYIHTVMRLDLEQRQGQNPSGLSNYTNASTSNNATSVSHCYFMQTQSNYSSGYASPAYTPDSSVNYYQQQTLAVPHTTHEQQQQSYGTHQDLHTPQYPLDNLDGGLFVSSSSPTPAYGELLTPTYHSLSYSPTQLSPYNAYHQAQPSQPSTTPSNLAVPPSAYSSCAVPSAPPFGNATTTASTAQYHHAIVLETTASMTSTTTFLATATAANAGTITCVAYSSPSATRTSNTSSMTGSFINLNTPIASSTRLSQINDLLQHNRNSNSALIAVSKTATAGYGNNQVTTILADSQRSACIAVSFEELPTPLINTSPILATMEHNSRKQQIVCPKSTPTTAVSQPPALPQPRQPLDVTSTEADEDAAELV